MSDSNVPGLRIKILGPLGDRLRAAVGPRGATKFVIAAVERALDELERPDADMLTLVPGGKRQEPTIDPVFGYGATLIPQVTGLIGGESISATGASAGDVAPRPDLPVGRAVFDMLSKNGQVESWLGQTALRTAYLLDTSKAVQGYAVLVKELRATMGQALGDLPAEEDDLARLLREHNAGGSGEPS